MILDRVVAAVASQLDQQANLGVRVRMPLPNRMPSLIRGRPTGAYGWKYPKLPRSSPT